MDALYILLPSLIAALVAFLASDRGRMASYIRHVSLAASLVALLLIVLAFSNVQKVSTLTWFSVSGFSFTITAATYPLNMLLLLLIGIITPLIFYYSYGFINVPSEQSRFYALMNLFAASMLLFAVSYSLITLFVSWSILGITSYMLIGFWYKKDKPARASRKAITTIIIGDVAMLSAIIILIGTYGSDLFSTILAQSLGTALYASLALIALAVFTKSAQFPFNEWLADAMEGPTPVSAYLHSSTMVKAGVLLIAVLLPLYSGAGLLWIFILFGTITAALGALNALSEHHIKRILAYSTTEDIGLMFVALGFGSVLAAMMLFVVQAFYKAQLFMSAGSIMKANSTDDLYESHNLQYRKMLYVPTAIGAASLMGVFPLGGFFGKTLVGQSATIPYVYVTLALIEFLSVLYMMRWILVPSRRAAQNLGAEINIGYQTLPRSMLYSGAFTAAMAILVSISYLYLPSYLGSPVNIKIAEAAIESVVIVVGFAIAYLAFNRNALPKAFYSERASAAIYNSVYTNWFYDKLALFFMLTGEAFAYVEDGVYYLFRSGGDSFLLLGRLIRKIENGNVNIYIAAFVAGFVALAAMFILGL